MAVTVNESSKKANQLRVGSLRKENYWSRQNLWLTFSLFSLFLFNFVKDICSETMLSLSEFPAADLPGDSLVNLKHANYIVLFGEDFDEMQFFDSPT